MSDHHPTCPRCGDICDTDRCECGAIVRDAPPKPSRIAWKPVYVACACGCGATFTATDRHKRPRRFVPGHNNKSGVKNGALTPAAKWWKSNHGADELRALSGEFYAS